MTPAVSSNMSIHHDYMETVLAVSLVTMMAFTALPYLAWVQSDVSRGFAALAAIALCIVATSLLVFFLARQYSLEQEELPLGR